MAGQNYLVELWVNASNNTTPTTETVTAMNSTSLQFNTTATTGGVGQFVTGTFTANSTGSGDDPTQRHDTGRGTDAILNAVEVRAVPEPSVWEMLAVGGTLFAAAMLLRGRRVKTQWEIRRAGATCTRMAAIAVVVVCGSTVRGATITWGTPTGISGGGDVSTLGTLFDAANPGGTGVTAQTVSGVTFNPLLTDGSAFSYSDASGRLTLSVPNTSTSKINGGNSFWHYDSSFQQFVARLLSKPPRAGIVFRQRSDDADDQRADSQSDVSGGALGQLFRSDILPAGGRNRFGREFDHASLQYERDVRTGPIRYRHLYRDQHDAANRSYRHPDPGVRRCAPDPV